MPQMTDSDLKIGNITKKMITRIHLSQSMAADASQWATTTTITTMTSHITKRTTKSKASTRILTKISGAIVATTTATLQALNNNLNTDKSSSKGPLRIKIKTSTKQMQWVVRKNSSVIIRTISMPVDAEVARRPCPSSSLMAPSETTQILTLACQVPSTSNLSSNTKSLKKAVATDRLGSIRQMAAIWASQSRMGMEAKMKVAEAERRCTRTAMAFMAVAVIRATPTPVATSTSRLKMVGPHESTRMRPKTAIESKLSNEWPHKK